ncbi:hypothetical protein SDRG_13970 [Saprolegnia diclina VS20]|uniref:Uncharacterized protein n=1 Tax=Saprolegnia diclina (strain VS20) TaxID=1156394 RepID=T0PS14_SAPDV|nr:hypothetical protein SDRG_13970 [Saprolegnia diclina VS20]EQC28289.1 hypothetical protein SDRG_13970 [Saprolegnia diclina VS20]|eukprot:XP_008618293.1 hypothetical protein SDRG_13970 [Saprolegnia diclina VS20]
MVMALALVNDSVASICAQETSTWCNESIADAAVVAPSVLVDHHLVSEAATAIVSLNVSLLQFASRASSPRWSLLLQPLLEPSFVYFSWIILFEWVRGEREVVSFEGDNGTLVLVSDIYDATSSTPSNAVLGRSSIGVYYILLYANLVLATVTAITLLSSALSLNGISIINVLAFTRVAGSTWIGRPLLLLRGVSALVLLSSGDAALVRRFNVHTQLTVPARSLVETFLFAWEATWVGYVVHELLLPLQAHDARFVGALTTMLHWLCMVVVDVASPVSVTATVTRSCVTHNVYYDFVCESVVVALGSTHRLTFLCALECALVPVLWLLLHLGRRSRNVYTYRVDARLSIVGQAFLLQGPPLDPVARLSSGLVALWRQGLLDLKLWRLLDTSPTTSLVMPMSSSVARPMIQGWGPRMWVALGTMYVGAAIYSSISYLGLAQPLLVNDLIWPDFNMTGSHLFLANWFNEHSYLGESATKLTDGYHVNALGQFNLSHVSVDFSIQQGARIQYTTLTAIVLLPRF